MPRLLDRDGGSHARSFETSSTFAALDCRDGVLTVRLHGPVVGDRETAIVRREIEAALARAGDGLRLLVLDLQGVEMLSSIGLGLCIDLRGHARRRGARTILYGLRPHLLALFRMTRVHRLYKIVRSEAELRRLTAA